MSDYEERYAWVVLPYRRQPLKTVVLVLTLIVIWAGVYFLFGDPWILGFSFVVLFGSVFYYFFPMKYTLDEDGITLRGVFTSKFRAWSEFRRWESDRYGVFLSPFQRASRLDNFRGVYVRFGEDPEEVRARMEYWFDRKELPDGKKGLQER